LLQEAENYAMAKARGDLVGATAAGVAMFRESDSCRADEPELRAALIAFHETTGRYPSVREVIDALQERGA
jgi:hypothetical protein